jgi:hypothetical protein
MREELRQAGLRHRQARQPVRRGRVPEDEGGIRKAYDLAYATDTESAFGGIIAFNRELDGETAKAIVERQFVEVIIAPKISRPRRGGRQAERAPAGVRRVASRARCRLGLQARQRWPAGAEPRHRHDHRRRPEVVTKRAPTEQKSTT